MESKYGETLSAFFDGEVVEPQLLAESFAQPGALALLMDFARMRARITLDQCAPRPEFFETVPKKMKEAASRRFWRRGFSKLALAAGLVLVVALAGFKVGSLVESRRVQAANRTAPPVATRTATAAPALTAPPSPATAESARPLPRAQQKTNGTGPPAAAIRLRLGDWRQATLTAEEPPERR